MKDMFFGYFRQDEKVVLNAWKEYLFVFDANILLNLYRYSDNTRNEFFRILETIKDRVWLPHRAAEEYFNNRLTVIGQQEQAYESTISDIKKLKEGLENSRQHPFVNAKVMAKATETFDLLCDQLVSNKEVHTKRISDDEIREKIANLFENSLGVPYTDEQLMDIFIEGETRYKQKIPPGYKDGAKTSDEGEINEKCRKFGDLIVWKQILEKATELKKGVILLTDDRKEDWWEQFKGKTIGPRPELVQEFREKTGQILLMYQADRFLALAQKSLGEQVDKAMVEEVREVQHAKRKLREMEMSRKRHYQINELVNELKHAKRRLSMIDQEFHELKEALRDSEIQREEIYRMTEGADFDDKEQADFMFHHRARLSEMGDEYREKLSHISQIRNKALEEVEVLQFKLGSLSRNLEDGPLYNMLRRD